MNLTINSTVTVLTPSMGSDKLKDAVDSVMKQTYASIKHLVVLDGPQAVSNYKNLNIPNDPKLDIVELPDNVGKNGFYGHRIYASFPHLINTDYIAFLDEDNWYDENHIETLLEVIKEGWGYSIGHSYRKIYDKDKNFICTDDCESLGPNYPIWFTKGRDPQYLIDTSAFMFSRTFIEKTAHLWHTGWGGDRNYLENARKLAGGGISIASNGRYSLNYRLDGNENSVSPQFFIEGNKVQAKAYSIDKTNGKYPWNHDYKELDKFNYASGKVINIPQFSIAKGNTL